jgi:N-acylneuraminate cytidylyltransferase/CMP-N,N'-diacetyllegionaminic acid synthase
LIAIIPARGGSKGLPGKNIKLLNGKPLISYTIEEALSSKFIKRVIVSTDDPKIAEVAMSFGAEVPFMRPAELASDNSKAIDTYIYTVEKLMIDTGKPINDFVVLLPTAPLRTSGDIDKAIEIYISKNAETVISVVEAVHPPTWYKKITDEGKLMDLFENVDNSLNRQESKKTYLPNGSIYIFDYKSLKKNNSYYNELTFPYVMDWEKSIDIDTIIDFKLAEILIKEANFSVLKIIPKITDKIFE